MPLVRENRFLVLNIDTGAEPIRGGGEVCRGSCVHMLPLSCSGWDRCGRPLFFKIYGQMDVRTAL